MDFTTCLVLGIQWLAPPTVRLSVGRTLVGPVWASFVLRDAHKSANRTGVSLFDAGWSSCGPLQRDFMATTPPTGL